MLPNLYWAVIERFQVYRSVPIIASGTRSGYARNDAWVRPDGQTRSAGRLGRRVRAVESAGAVRPTGRLRDVPRWVALGVQLDVRRLWRRLRRRRRRRGCGCRGSSGGRGILNGWLQSTMDTDREAGTDLTATMTATTGDRRAAGRFGQVGERVRGAFMPLRDWALIGSFRARSGRYGRRSVWATAGAVRRGARARGGQALHQDARTALSRHRTRHHRCEYFILKCGYSGDGECSVSALAYCMIWLLFITRLALDFTERMIAETLSV